MSAIRSRLSTLGSDYRQRREHMLALLGELDERLAAARNAGGEKQIKKLQKRAKLSPRERVERLLDRDGPFLELSPLAAYGQYGDEAPARAASPGSGGSAAGRC